MHVMLVNFKNNVQFVLSPDICMRRRTRCSVTTAPESSLQAGLPSPLRELTCHMGSHSVTCHPAEVTFPSLPQPKLVLDLATPEGCKAELTQVVG